METAVPLLVKYRLIIFALMDLIPLPQCAYNYVETDTQLMPSATMATSSMETAAALAVPSRQVSLATIIRIQPVVLKSAEMAFYLSINAMMATQWMAMGAVPSAKYNKDTTAVVATRPTSQSVFTQQFPLSK